MQSKTDECMWSEKPYYHNRTTTYCKTRQGVGVCKKWNIMTLLVLNQMWWIIWSTLNSCSLDFQETSTHSLPFRLFFSSPSLREIEDDPCRPCICEENLRPLRSFFWIQTGMSTLSLIFPLCVSIHLRLRNEIGGAVFIDIYTSPSWTL